jgi:hypothetical protein
MFEPNTCRGKKSVVRHGKPRLRQLLQQILMVEMELFSFIDPVTQHACIPFIDSACIDV